jgi:mannose-1-phosphate guanylyltransferase
MDALILAAGFGKRLGSLTTNNQKCLLPINGKPLLNYWIDFLCELNINKIYINSHHCAQDLTDLININPYKKKISILHEPELLGTAGTLRNNIKLFKNDLFFIHGDNYINYLQLKKFYEYYIASEDKDSLFFMMLNKTNEPHKCGVVELENNIVKNFYEKVLNPPSNIANAAIYILRKKFLFKINKLDAKTTYNFSEDVIPKFLGKIHGYLSDENVIDIGEQYRYEKVR